MDPSQATGRDHMALKALRIAVISDPRVRHRGVLHDLHGDSILPIRASHGDVRAGQRDQTLFRVARRIQEPDTKQPQWIDEDLVARHAAVS
jgi:hypothetical protein